MISFRHNIIAKSHIIELLPDLYISMCRYDSALTDFDKAQTNLRGNPFIDYKQLGLQYKLYACEVREGGGGGKRKSGWGWGGGAV